MLIDTKKGMADGTVPEHGADGLPRTNQLMPMNTQRAKVA